MILGIYTPNTNAQRAYLKDKTHKAHNSWLVSIIIPSFNTAAFLDYALCSVLNQSYPHWEAIVVDDASVDDSRDIIESYANRDKRFKPIYLQSNQGVSAARNLVLLAANGRFIAFLDSDDVWEKHKLELQVKTILEQDVALSYGAYRVISQDGVGLGDFIPKGSLDYEDMLKTCQIGNSTAMYDTYKVGKIQSGSIRHDYELWLSILRQHSSCIAPPPVCLKA